MKERESMKEKKKGNKRRGKDIREKWRMKEKERI